jgi:YegS/Rv2252/BmrU family lipid kinase
MSGHTVVIVNPRSAGGRTGRRWHELAALLRDAYGPFEDCYTEGPGDGTRLARQALREGADTVVAVGGDGSINEVMNGFFEPVGDVDQDPVPVRAGAALGIIPLGTGGDLIRSLGIPRDPIAAARALAAASPKTVDVGRVRYVDHEGRGALRHFVNVASFGIAGLVDKYVNESRKTLHGTLAFALATLRAGVTYSNSQVRLRSDGGDWRTGPIYNVSIANARFFGGGMKVAPEARMDDGLLELITFGDMGLVDLLKDGLDLYSGRHVELAKVSTTRVRAVEAEAADGREVLLDIDGEQPGRLPARFEIVPAALALRAPELPA